jgi:DNA-directed RNA polymerase specialized sigma24 family protein
MATQQSMGKLRARIPGQRHVTPESFASLLVALGDAGKQEGAHYEQLRSKLIFFFSRRSMLFPEDLADEVLDRLAQRVSDGTQIASIPGFALGIARHVAQEQSAGKNCLQTMGDDFWDNVPAYSATQSNEEEIACMERCLKMLPSAERQILKAYYLSSSDNLMQARKSLAERIGISPNTLRQRVFLARQSLRACMMAVERKKRR